MAYLWIFVAFLFTGRFVKGSEESGIIVTMMPRLLFWPTAKDLFMIPGTPYDLARNQTLYEDIGEFGIPNHMTTKLILQSCKADYSRKILYMYDKAGSAKIVAMSTVNWRNPSPTKIRQVHTGVSKGNVKVAVDWVSHNIYWTDPLFRWIAMQPGPVNLTDYSQDKSLYKIIIKDDLEQPYALAVDAVGGNLFWSDISKYPKIERASLTGAHRTQIISTGLKFPVAMDIDVSATDRRIYWVDSGRDTIESANLSGGERRIIRRMSHTKFYDLALFRDILSVVDRGLSTVHFINKTNGQITTDPYNRTRESVRGKCMYNAEVQPARKDYCAEALCSDICVNELNRATCLCREGFKLHSNGYLCLEDTSLYHRAIVVSDGSAIYLIDIRSLAGNRTAYPMKNIYTSTVGKIKFMTLDMVDRNIIFATDDEIYSVKIDVSNASAQHIISSPNTITGLSIDWRDKNIYWSSGILFGRISVVSQGGGNMYHLQTGLLHPRYLTVLALESKMVWLSGMYAPRIEMSNLDGTAKTTVVSTENLLIPKSLHFDSHTSRLYYIDRRNIKRVYLNGTGQQTIKPIAIAPNLIFVYQNYIVWTDDISKNTSTIDTADISKPGRTLFTDSFANASSIQAIAVLDASLQPSQKGPCEADNGGCEHICIPLGRNRVCKCEHGFTKDDNGRTCSSVPLEDNFILVADWSHNKIYQISMVNDDVRAVDIQTAGNPNAVIYRPSDKRLIWADTKDKQVHSTYLNGSDHKMIVNAGIYGSFVDRLAIDSSSGNLYYTCVGTRFFGFDGVSVITPKGDSRDLVKRGYTLRDIVVDPEEGLMFWTDHGLFPSVKRANMDGTLVTDISPTTMKWPNGIAIDQKEKHVYISDGKLNTIQKCSYYGVCSVIHTDTEAHLMDIELSGQYLYYTAWNRPYITKMNKTSPSDISRIASNAELGRLDALSVYSSGEEKTVSEKCLPNKGLGDCSTICLPTQSGRTCTCKDGVSLWPNSTICKDIPKCTSNIQDGAIIGTCTYLHLAACSFKCDRFHRPTTKDMKITCDNGLWDEPNPCIFSDTKCPATVASVLFGSGCSYNNNETCTYNCTPRYIPTSKSKIMMCDNGEWDNQQPCEKIAPDCPVEVDKVSFPDSCNFQNGEVCTYSCTSGSISTATNMSCTGSSWNKQTPCREPTTVKMTTTTVTSSSTADSTPREDTAADINSLEDTVTPARLEGQSPVNIAAAAGGAACGLILIIIIIVAIFLIRKRYKRSGSADFTSPIYQDLDTVSSRISVPTVIEKQDTTYDLNVYDNFGGDDWYSDGHNIRNQNVYSC